MLCKEFCSTPLEIRRIFMQCVIAEPIKILAFSVHIIKSLCFNNGISCALQCKEIVINREYRKRLRCKIHYRIDVVISGFGYSVPYLLRVLRLSRIHIRLSARYKRCRRRGSYSVISRHHCHCLCSAARISRNAYFLGIDFGSCKHIINSAHLIA